MKKMKKLVLVLTMLVTMCATSILAFADYGSAKEVVDAYAPGGSAGNTSMPSSLASYVKTSSSKDTDDSTVVDGVTYYWSTSNADKIISAGNKMEQKTNQSGNDDTAIQNFSDVTNGFGIAADVETAGNMLSGFTGVLRTLLGAIVVIASLGMTVYSGFDICYIAFPVFRNKCEDAKQNGGGVLASNRKTASGDNKLRFVSDDAQYAVVAADTTQSGRNPFVIYFQKRLISYLVLAVLLFILLTGRVTIFTDIALKLVSGLLDIIQQI